MVAFDIIPCSLYVCGMQKQWKKLYLMFSRRLVSVFVMLPDLLEFSRYWTEELKSAQMGEDPEVGLWH